MNSFPTHFDLVIACACYHRLLYASATSPASASPAFSLKACKALFAPPSFILFRANSTPAFQSAALPATTNTAAVLSKIKSTIACAFEPSAMSDSSARGARGSSKEVRRVAFCVEVRPRTVESGWSGRPKSRVGCSVRGVIEPCSSDQAWRKGDHVARASGESGRGKFTSEARVNDAPRFLQRARSRPVLHARTRRVRARCPTP